MKKIAISLAALAVVAGSAFAAKQDEAGPGNGVSEGVLDCSGAAQVTCGDSVSGPLGPGGTGAAYGCTTLSYDFAEEAVSEICVGADGQLDLTMTYAHEGSTNDLDLFLLGSCDPADCIDSSLLTSGIETISAPVASSTTQSPAASSTSTATSPTTTSGRTSSPRARCRCRPIKSPCGA